MISMGSEEGKIRGISEGIEREWMRGVGKEIRDEILKAGEEIKELRKNFEREIGEMKEEVREIKRQRIIQKQKEQAVKGPSVQPPKPKAMPSIKDMRSEWAVLVASVDKMSRTELIDARDRIQWLGNKLDAALGENFLLITQNTVKKIDQKLR